MSRRGALITLLVTLAVAFGLLALTQFTGTTPRLGLDLQGGFSVVLAAPQGTDAAGLPHHAARRGAPAVLRGGTRRHDHDDVAHLRLRLDHHNDHVARLDSGN